MKRKFYAMRTLKNHTLIYDRDCPMCRIYTSAFVKRGWLDAEGRLPFSEVDEGRFTMLDTVRATNEIALVNRETGTITYGLESLTAIAAHRLPFLKPVLQNRIVRRVLQHLYSFISYNRKVIAAVKPAGRPCNPSYHVGYRVAYLLFAFLITALVLTKYTGLMVGLLPAGPDWREYAVAGGQIVFQGAVLLYYRRGVLIEYLGNLMTVSLMGAIALLPVLALSHWFTIGPLPAAIYFLMIAGGMLLEHLRRMQLLHLGILPSLTWILYRCLALCTILYL